MVSRDPYNSLCHDYQEASEESKVEMAELYEYLTLMSLLDAFPAEAGMYICYPLVSHRPAP